MQNKHSDHIMDAHRYSIGVQSTRHARVAAKIIKVLAYILLWFVFMIALFAVIMVFFTLWYGLKTYLYYLFFM